MGWREGILLSSARRAPFVVVLPLLWAACGGGRVQSVPDDPTSEDTTLGVGDVFDVRVYGDESLSASYRVAQDGTIDFPLLGRVVIAGLEPPEVADYLTERLREGGFLTQPQVSVFVQAYDSKRVSVMGAVARAGAFPLTPGLTALQAISQAGGFTALANRNSTTLTRRVDGELKRFLIPVDEITAGNEPDPPLRAGDMLFVPERIF